MPASLYLGSTLQREAEMMEARDMDGQRLGINYEMLVHLVNVNGSAVIIAALKTAIDMIERGAYEPETMH